MKLKPLGGRHNSIEPKSERKASQQMLVAKTVVICSLLCAAVSALWLIIHRDDGAFLQFTQSETVWFSAYCVSVVIVLIGSYFLARDPASR